MPTSPGIAGSRMPPSDTPIIPNGHQSLPAAEGNRRSRTSRSTEMGKRSRDPVDAEVAKRVRALRLERGLSQTELSDALGVTFQQVQKYERGANRISAGRLFRIAKVFDVPVTFFFP